jgi:hypothetical protein
MARIKVRFELNKGRTGAPLSKLGDISKQAEKFLKALATDLAIDARAGEWLAVNFKNGSVSYDAEFQVEITGAEADAFNRGLEFLADFDAENEGANGSVTKTTVLEFARLGSLIDPDEVIGLGIYGRDRVKPKMRQITYAQTSQMRSEVEAPIPTYGSVQGVIHSLIKEAERPYFRIRELATADLVSCFYPGRLYDAVALALQQRTNVLHVGGPMKFDRAKRTITEMTVERMETARMMSPAEFEGFFGSAPTFTGDMTTEEWIDSVRSHAG